jgi:hypothetical protein
VHIYLRTYEAMQIWRSATAQEKYIIRDERYPSEAENRSLRDEARVNSQRVSWRITRIATISRRRMRGLLKELPRGWD